MTSSMRRVPSRATPGSGFGDALVQTLEPHLLEELGPLDELLDPESYLGETPAIVDAALEIWKSCEGSAGGGRRDGDMSATGPDERAVTSELIDTHLHIWDLERGDYPWLGTGVGDPLSNVHGRRGRCRPS